MTLPSQVTATDAEREQSPSITISIVTYNSAAEILPCLGGLLADGLLGGVEVIVVDNASTDATVDIVRQHFPSVQIIENRTNRYFGPAHNQSARAARGRYFAIINPDTLIPEGTVTRLVAAMDQRGDLGVLAPLICSHDGAILDPEFHNYWGHHSLMYAIFGRSRQTYAAYQAVFGRGERLETNPAQEFIFPDVVTGAFMVTTTRLFRFVGGFDGRLRMYWTEDDLCDKISSAGFAVGCLTTVRVRHSVSASVRRSNQYLLRWIYAMDGMLYYVRRGKGWERALCIPLLSVAFAVDATVISGRRLTRWARSQHARAE
ncbi:MAG: glycosyltransferase family 2 protein [Candidatus Dormibacteria bacterium]